MLCTKSVLCDKSNKHKGRCNKLRRLCYSEHEAPDLKPQAPLVPTEFVEPSTGLAELGAVVAAGVGTSSSSSSSKGPLCDAGAIARLRAQLRKELIIAQKAKANKDTEQLKESKLICQGLKDQMVALGGWQSSGL